MENNESSLTTVDLAQCGCSNPTNQNFRITRRLTRKGRTVGDPVFILKCKNCSINTGFQPTIERAVKVWNECLTGNSQEFECFIIKINVEIVEG